MRTTTGVRSQAVPAYDLRVSQAASDFPAYLARAIKAAGFAKPTFFAKAADLDPSVVFRWLNGEQTPTIKSLSKIAPVLDVPLNDLVAAAHPSHAQPPEPDRAEQDARRYTDPETGEAYTDLNERIIWDMRGKPEETRRELIYYLRAKQEAQRRRSTN
jgi:transcriptional regulator with XRE-family HTH domain